MHFIGVVAFISSFGFYFCSWLISRIFIRSYLRSNNVSPVSLSGLTMRPTAIIEDYLAAIQVMRAKKIIPWFLPAFLISLIAFVICIFIAFLICFFGFSQS